MRTFLPLLSAVFLAVGTMAVSAAGPRTPDQWIAELDKAFAVKSGALKPPFVIFPMLDASDRVSADGGGFSDMALFAAVFTTRKHIDIPVRMARSVLHATGAAKAKTRLDNKTIRLCLNALGAKLYAIPKLARRGDADVLTIVCHGDGGKYPDKTFTHTLKPRNRCKIPGLIAHSVHEFLGVQLTPQEREMVAAPQLQTEQDLRTLLDLDAGRRLLAAKPALLLDLLKRNPRCVLGWEIAITSHATRHEALRRFQELQPPLACPRLHVAVAVQVREFGEPERALNMLLPYAAMHRGDTSFYSTLTKCAMRMKDERLTRHVLELWRTNDPSYLGCLNRGERFIQWAWDARGNGWANTVTPEGARQFHKRLLEAARELNEALQINGDGWAAHAQLIAVAKGLGLPRPFVEKHFQQAVKLLPRYLDAYQAKMEYLRPRWHGSPAEMIAFGRQCAATGFWDQQIPRLFPYALNDCYTNPRDRGRDYAILQSPLVWQGVLAYYRGAQKSAGLHDREWALNQFVQWGIFGEHYDDIVVPCQKLRRPDRINRLIFPDAAELEFFYDLVHAKTGKLMTRLSSPLKNDLALAKMGAALAEGDVEQAAKWIEKIEAGDDRARAQAASYRAALAVGRKLLRDNHVDLQGAEGLEAFVGARPLWKYSGDKFVCSLPPRGNACLTFPLGLKHGVISGVVEGIPDLGYAQMVTHTRAARDQVILRYQRQKLYLVRNNYPLQEAIQPPQEPFAFRLVYDGERDTLQPAAGIVWNANVYNDIPSGFRLEFFAADRPATIVLRGLRIERRE